MNKVSIPNVFPPKSSYKHHEKNTALGSKGLPVLGSIPFFSILVAARILLASSNPTFFTAIIRLIAALSLSSSPARWSPFTMLSVKSNVELENPASISVAKEPGRKRGRGIYAFVWEKKEVISLRLGMRGSHMRRVRKRPDSQKGLDYVFWGADQRQQGGRGRKGRARRATPSSRRTVGCLGFRERGNEGQSSQMGRW